MAMQQVCILGSTGSIGRSTLDVLARHPGRLRVRTLSAHSRMEALAQQAHQHQAAIVIVPDDAARQRFLDAWPAGATLPRIHVGAQALCEAVSDPVVTTVMAAIVGAAGLPSVLAAARAGKRILLANKEALVAAGSLLMQAVRESGAELLPIDSEHNAIFQCLPPAGQVGAPSRPARGVRRLLLTASGGPFLKTPLAQLDDITPDQACAHPNWRMGRKISVDSATMVNKGLEVMEAHWLFAMPQDRIQVVIHPQSVVHSMVEYEDGSILAQMGQPDMRTPIAHGLGFPERIESGVGLMTLTQMGRLDFEAPDLDRFPCLALAFCALRSGQHACIAFNAANEVAVARFLAGRLRYTRIAGVISACLDHVQTCTTHALHTLEDILALDDAIRRFAASRCHPDA